MKFDMNKMLQEAQRMQEELAKAQEEAASEVVEASAGGGMVTVKANGAGEIVSITIDPRAIDPDDPELLADLVLAAVNEALRSGAFADGVEDVGARSGRSGRASRRVTPHADKGVRGQRRKQLHDPTEPRTRARRRGACPPSACAPSRET